MNDARRLFEATAALRRERRPFCIATVARVRGSAYRRPGARMIIAEHGWVAGSVSGGCLEGDLARKAWWYTERGPAVVTYDSTDDDTGFALGCGGAIDVLVERARVRRAATDPMRFIAGCLASQRTGAIATVIREGFGAPIGARACLRADGVRAIDGAAIPLAEELFTVCAAAIGGAESTAGLKDALMVERIQPPPRLFVLGAGHDVEPIVEIGRAVGWAVIVFDALARPDSRRRFCRASAVLAGDRSSLAASIDASDRAAVVVMDHHLDRDRAALAMALRSRAKYIGVLAPRDRTASLLADPPLAAFAGDRRLHAPVGLALGGETPQEIALAIIAEAQAAFAVGPPVPSISIRPRTSRR